MYHSPALLFLDAAAAVLMLVLASLSKGLGSALKIRPYYLMLYVCAGMVLFASLLTAVCTDYSSAGKTVMPFIASSALRLLAGITAVAISLRYWKWLFTEFFKK